MVNTAQSGKRSQVSTSGSITLIEIRPHRWGWKVFEAPGVEPVFPEKQDAIDYARAVLASAQATVAFCIATARSLHED
jgi:uncharacterized protein DUF2188